MLTKLLRVSFAIAVVALVLWASTAFAHPETLSGARQTSCYGAKGFFSCVTNWHKTHGEAGPRHRTEQELAASVERDRKWVDRCRPVIRQDHYGVDRYHYAAPGCEFGKTED
jgi:hypothetical protein